MGQPVWNLTLFGSLRAHFTGCEITKFRTQKAGVLLAYLACHPHRAHRRDDLAEMLWPEDALSADKINHRLSVTLNYLRKALEVPATSTPLFFTDRATIRLNADLVSTDRAQFEEHLREAQEAPTDDDKTLLLKQAVDLYTGDLLADYREEWIEGERRRLNDACLAGLRHLTKLLAQTGRYEESLQHVRRSLAFDPLNETLHQHLMKLYVAVRRPRAALRQYQELTITLRRDLKTLPAEATTTLAQEIAAKYAGGVNPNGPIVAQGEAYGTSPFSLQSRRATLGTWPALTKRFFGRQDDIQHVCELLATPEKRLITLTGTAGCGKTHLALAIMQKMHEEFEGTTLFVSLASLTRADAIPDAIVEAVQLPRDGEGDPLEETIRLLSEGPTLLVLDNMEHLLDEGGAVIWALLNLIPSLICLITSRQLLNLSIEQEYVVRPLPLPQQAGSSERMMEFPSIQLFLDRAQIAQPDFQADSNHLKDVVALCERLDGLPLGIELAAAWTKTLTPAQILLLAPSRIKTRHVDMPTRHISLHTALEWSYALLPLKVKRFFVSLCVFRRGWDLETATEVCNEPLTLEYLTHLRDRSLLDADVSQAAARYTLLETVREYAQERLSKAESRRLGRRHADYFLRMAEESVFHLQRETAVFWLDRLQTEHDNFRAALRFCVAEGEPEMGLRLATSLWRFWLMRGFLTEGCSWLKTMLADAPDAEQSLRSRAFSAAGNLAYTDGDLDKAQQCFSDALAIRRALSDERGAAASLGSLGLVSCDRRDYSQARILLEQSIEIFTRFGDADGVAKSQGNLVVALVGLRDYGAAQTLHAACLAAFRAQGDPLNQALALNNLAGSLLQNNEVGLASSYIVEALSIGCQLRHAGIIAQSIMGCVALAIHREQREVAAHLLGAFKRSREAITGRSRALTMEEYHQKCEIIKNALGEADFDALWHKGYAMPTAQILTYTAPLF